MMTLLQHDNIWLQSLKLLLFFHFLGKFNFITIIFAHEVTIRAGDLGTIKGVKQTTVVNARNYVVFSGIPFAQSTKGQNRFKPSVLRTGPLTSNNGTFVASDILSVCPQNNFLFQKAHLEDSLGPLIAAIDEETMKRLDKLSKEDIDSPNTNSSSSANKLIRFSMGHEDCLTITISTPKLPTSEKDKKLPCIVFIHGGSFTGVWGSLFNGARLLDRDVILITFNYRLGILGFLNLGVDEAPGNAGLYDCITALKWVHRYISYFGGDPSRVTISGQSAGASMVSHLVASPLTKGLFHGAIASSGSALQQWSVVSDPIPHALTVARHAGCYNPFSHPNHYKNQPNFHEIAKCMQKVSKDTLVEALNQYISEDRVNGNFGFSVACPSVQSRNLQTERLLPEDPMIIFQQGKQNNVPLMMGATKHDGSYVLRKAVDEFLIPNDFLKDSAYIQNNLTYDILKLLGTTDNSMAVVDAIEETYLGKAMHSHKIEDKWPGYMDIFSVFTFKALGYRNLQLQAEIQTDCYWYAFDYKGYTSLLGMLNLGGPIPFGVAHADDLCYLFQFLPLISYGERKVSSRLVDYWVNFAYYGNPNGAFGTNLWPRYSAKSQKYLRIHSEDTVREHYKREWKGAAAELFQ